MQDQETDAVILTVTEATRFLRLNRNSVYEAIRRGEIPAFHVGRRILISRDKILRLLRKVLRLKGEANEINRRRKLKDAFF